MTFNEAVELLSENGKFDRNKCATELMHLEKLGILKFNEENKTMDNNILRRKEAIKFCQMEGYKLFIDKLIRDKVIVLEDEPLKTILIIDDPRNIIIRRHGKTIYED